jgi:4-hydroxymandelate oxidase
VLAAAKAHHRTIAVLPSSVSHALPELTRSHPEASFWSQIYISGDRNGMLETVRRAEEAQCAAIVLDGRLDRRRQVRMELSELPFLPWKRSLLRRSNAKPVPASFDDLIWLCRTASVPVTVKGGFGPTRPSAASMPVLERSCFQPWRQSIGWRSRHGRRAAVHADAVGAEIEVYVDCGVRSGLSVRKALPLNTRAVLVGRPADWGLAADGEAGLGSILGCLGAELSQAMLYCGVSETCKVSADLLSASLRT